MNVRIRRLSLPLCAVMLVSWQGRPPRGGGGTQFDACRLLGASDAAVLLGDGATSQLTQGGQNCTWRSADGKKQLMVKTPEASRTKPDVTFDHFRNGPHSGYVIADEKELGEHAASALTSFGLEFMVLKKDRILDVQYWAPYGTKGTAELLAQARPVIKKAVDAF